MSSYKVLVADPLSPSGVEELNKFPQIEAVVRTGLKEDELVAIIPEFAGLVVRSQTKVTARVLEAATSLRAVGRAGVGVDNIDVEAATRRGIVVMNTPDGNTISTAEHAFALLVSLARKIPQAHASIVSGKWDRKSFEGVELYGKTLAILGLGRIGTELARRAMAFGMRVLAYDPYLSASRARSLQVELGENLDEVVALADFITVHMPLTPETRHMLDARRLALCKRGVRLVNCARGGLIAEDALLAALQSGHVAGAALDVFETEPPAADFPLRSRPDVVLTPHLGASTAEAQESVGIEVARAIGALLMDGTVKNAVNMPNLDAKTLEVIKPYLDFGAILGRFLAQTSPKRCEKLHLAFSGKVTAADTKPVVRAILHSFLASIGGSDVNPVNALAFADQLGIKVSVSQEPSAGDYTDLVELTATSGAETASVGGTFFGPSPRIVRINGRSIEAKPEGFLLLLENTDRPGIVGRVGSLLGVHNVNIAHMSLSRNTVGGQALTVLNLDSAPPREVKDQLLASGDITSARLITL